MKKLFYPFLFLTFALSTLILIFSFNVKEESPILNLDHETYIQPIVDNYGTPSAFLRTFKLKYKDHNTRVQRSDSTYYRCAYETQMIMYSAFDTLRLESVSQHSCDIVAWFNLRESQIAWLKVNYVYYIKIKNLNTKYEQLYENPDSKYFARIIIQNNK